MEYDRAYYRGKTAVVTGAASGIGLGLIEELLESGAAKVVLADINPAHLKEHGERLDKEYPGRVKGIVCDVTREDSVRNMISEAVAFFAGRFDLLINNAGAGFHGWFEELTDAEWKAAFDLNFWGPFYGMRAAIPIMVKQGGGQIVNIVSGIAFLPMAGQSRYAVTKAALNALALALRSEYWDNNLKISSATPGTTATAIWGDLEAPKNAQTPRQSASRILDGVTKNDRIIYGDDADAEGITNSTLYAAREHIDQYLLNVARQRRKGIAAV